MRLFTIESTHLSVRSQFLNLLTLFVEHERTTMKLANVTECKTIYKNIFVKPNYLYTIYFPLTWCKEFILNWWNGQLEREEYGEIIDDRIEEYDEKNHCLHISAYI